MLYIVAAIQVLCIFNSAYSESISWTEDHKTCQANLPSSIKSCFEMPYIQYVQHELHFLESKRVKSWKYEILQAINDLYVDLRSARVPSLICITKCNNGSTKVNSKSIHPISFGIPERFITDSVPYKVF